MEFDYCIVDEACQLSQPSVIGAILLAKRFVLVGDDYQLPPLVQSSEALRLGMDVSLFKRLAGAHPPSVITLSEQYRMNSEIMELSNCLIYDQHLKCGSTLIASGRLKIPRAITGFQGWIERSINPSFPVVFIDTDSFSTQENKFCLETYHKQYAAPINMTEVKIIKTLYASFLK
jgi:DNA replication ATP-dependent helicase Dna2